MHPNQLRGGALTGSHGKVTGHHNYIDSAWVNRLTSSIRLAVTVTFVGIISVRYFLPQSRCRQY
ncbi:MAG: hypothetical protein J7463_05290 [Roseiflexus sp.]|nr:hypothetical protein [Roseiflexus sp.]MBO9333327.1 hypothetical protein [Roseiflexus sp.]MBO9365065.1 hypothetical protein [Roseiflexus sp.]MBO9381344.1 hypothetical protein [Roseiflexus sp.]MBO9387336.1 hypothetical protein [Roseiflexus sp.]